MTCLQKGDSPSCAGKTGESPSCTGKAGDMATGGPGGCLQTRQRMMGMALFQIRPEACPCCFQGMEVGSTALAELIQTFSMGGNTGASLQYVVNIFACKPEELAVSLAH